MSIGNIVSKTIGLGAIGIVGYETVKMAKIDAHSHTIKESTDHLTDVFVNDQTAGYSGTVINGFRKFLKNHLLESSIYETIIGVKNAVTSTVGNVFGSAVTIGLGVGALFTGSKKPALLRKLKIALLRHTPKIRKAVNFVTSKLPSFGKVCATLLVLEGLRTLVVDGFGIGKKSEL